MKLILVNDANHFDYLACNDDECSEMWMKFGIDYKIFENINSN